jgi:hypothetical protein
MPEQTKFSAHGQGGEMALQAMALALDITAVEYGPRRRQCGLHAKVVAVVRAPAQHRMLQAIVDNCPPCDMTTTLRPRRLAS